MKCELCNCELVEKNILPYGKKGSECHISRHHYFPKRLRKFFDEKEIQEKFGIKNINDKINLCFLCHEELIHNIIFSPKTIKKLRRKMLNKNFKERVIILFKAI